MSRRSKSDRISGRRRPTVEGLESRQLLAVTIATYPLASPQSLPFQITPGPGGNLWFTENRVITVGGTSTAVGAIASINPTTKAITEYNIPYPGSSPRGIVWGPDGDLWFTDVLDGSIGQFDPSNHAIVEYPVPTANSGPTGIAVGSDGNLWFTEINTGKVGKISPTTHQIVEYPLGTTTSRPQGIVSGPDGDLWVAEVQNIAQIVPATHAISEFSVPNSIGFGTSTTGALAFAPDGDLDFGTLSVLGPRGANAYGIDVMNPTTHAVSYNQAGPVNGIAAGPNGKMYFTTGASIGEFDQATDAVTFSTPIVEPPGTAALATGITLGPDGNLWFTDIGLIGAATVIPANQNSVTGSLAIAGIAGTIPVPGRTVYVDVNADGTFDAGDPSGVTDAFGNFTINGSPSGNYTLRVVNFPGDVTSTQSLTLTGGQLVQNQVLLLQPTAAILPLTYSLTPFGTSNPDVTTAEVTALYNIVLGRAPDAPGLAYWVGAIKGGTPYAQVASAFLHSTAYDQRVVAADYQTFAGRAPSPSESATWVGLMQQGYTEEQIASLMINSPGFNAQHPDNASFVQALYGDLLGRQGSASEVAAWGAFLAGGGSRATVANLFIHSAGAAQRAVDGFYQIMLGRPADPTGEAFYVSGLEAGSTLADVALAFLTTPEYIRRADATVTG